MTNKPDVSVVVLLEEESLDFAHYIAVLHDLFRGRGTSFELLIIANGLEGFLKTQMLHLPNGEGLIKAFSFRKRVSQAVCVRAALKESLADVLVMCGSYQQITADGYGRLMDAFDEGVDLVSPWRDQRVDPSFNQFQSRLFNRMLAIITGSHFHDLSCNTRVFRREVLEKTRIYGNQYRFLPILAQQQGYRVREITCAHFQERGKTGLYSFAEYMGRIVDINTVYFNARFSRKPLRFFSIIGSVLLAGGGLITLWIFMQKVFFEMSIGNSPELLIGIILMVAGIETAGLGLLGEIIAFTHGRQRKEYTIEKVI